MWLVKPASDLSRFAMAQLFLAWISPLPLNICVRRFLLVIFSIDFSYLWKKPGKARLVCDWLLISYENLPDISFIYSLVVQTSVLLCTFACHEVSFSDPCLLIRAVFHLRPGPIRGSQDTRCLPVGSLEQAATHSFNFMEWSEKSFSFCVRVSWATALYHPRSKADWLTPILRLIIHPTAIHRFICDKTTELLSWLWSLNLKQPTIIHNGH